MSFGKNRKHSGMVLAGVTTVSIAASAASQGVVRALPQNSAATSLLNNVSGENVKNVGGSTVNFLKDNYGWVAIIVVVAIGVISILKWGFSGGDEKKGTVTNTNNNEERRFINENEKNEYLYKKEYVTNPYQKNATKGNFKFNDNNKVNNSLNVIDDEENIFKINNGEVSNSLNIISNKDEMNDNVKNSLKVYDCDEVSHSLNNLDISSEVPKYAFENLGENYIDGD